MSEYKLYIKFTPELSQEIRDKYTEKQGQLSEDSGFDLYCDDNYTITGDKPCHFIDLKINCAMMNTTTGRYVGYYLYPRSSFSKKRLIMGNHTGIIDSGYRGNIKGAVRLYPTPINELETIDMFKIISNMCS